MKEKILPGIISALLIASILAAVKGVFEFQDVKAKVDRQESKLGIIATVVCRYAIKDNLKGAEGCLKLIGE